MPVFEIPSPNEQKLKLCLKEQKYLEQISVGNYRNALDTLRSEVTPLHQDSKNLHHLASLLLCRSSEELKQTVDWEDDKGKILKKMQAFIPSSIMIPSARLSILVNQALSYQINNCSKHCGFFKAETLLEDHSCEEFGLPIKYEKMITETNEVWDIVISHNGDMIAALCKEASFTIWNLNNGEKIVGITGDTSGIGWSLDDKFLATGTNNGTVNVWCTSQGTLQYSLKEHTAKVTSCCWISPSQLLTGGVDRKLLLWENRQKVKQWDIRVRQIEKSEDGGIIAVLHASKNEITILGNSPLDKINAIIEDDSVACIQINRSGTQIIAVVSFSQPVIYM